MISAINKVFTKFQDSAINKHGRSSNITKLNHQRHGLKQNKTWDPKDLLINEEKDCIFTKLMICGVVRAAATIEETNKVSLFYLSGVEKKKKKNLSSLVSLYCSCAYYLDRERRSVDLKNL